MTTLQLVAGRLKIGGPISNDHVSPTADIALVAGRSEVTLDSSVSPLTTLRPLASRRDLGGAAQGIVVDVTPRGSLSAGRVTMSVSGRGAGVSYAGGGQSTIGDFTITADGRVRTRGAKIQAEKALKIKAAGVEILNRRARQSTLTSLTRSVTIVARASDIALQGQVTGAERTEGDSDSHGGVTLKVAGDIRLSTDNAERLALAFASKDDLYVEAGGDLKNATGRLLANAALVLSITGTIENATETSQPSTTFQRNTTGAPLLPFKAGLYHLARADPTVECVPVWIDNLNRVMPKGEVLPVPLLCSVSFGEPLNPREGEGKQAFLARARAALLSLAPSYRWTVA